MPNVLCPACAKSLKVSDAAAGKSGRCPSCQHRFTLPTAEPQRPVAARPIEDTPAPTPPVLKKRKKKKRKPARRAFPWKLLVAVGGVVALALVLVAVVGGAGLFGGGGDIARDPKPDQVGHRGYFDSTVYDGEFLPADPATWAVKVEVAEPAPPNLRATTPYPDADIREPIAFAFADPNAAAAAVLYKPGRGVWPLAWGQVALTDAGASKSVPLDCLAQGYGPPVTHSQVALSTAGGRLATYGPSRKSAQKFSLENGGAFGIIVWNRDGTKLADWVETESPAGQAECQGMWFASEDRVLIAAKGTLRCREAATGKLVYERPLKLLDGAALSPRRTWLFAGVEGGVEAVATADGATAGRLAVPGISEGGGTCLAVSADGTRLATASHGDHGIPLMTWTLADGKPESPTARFLSRRSKWFGKMCLPGQISIPQVQWCGDRQLLLNGHDVYDLDLGGAVYSLGEEHSVQATGGVRGPDGRAWRAMGPRRNAVEAFKKALPDGGGYYISAVSVPAWPTDGVICGPNTAYRVAAEGVSTHRRAAAEALADSIALYGLRVDPQAELTACVVGKSINSERLTTGRERTATFEENRGRDVVILEYVDGFTVTYQLEIRDKQGRVLWAHGGSGGAKDPDGKGRVLAWQSAGRNAAGLVPVTPFLLKPGEERAELPIYVLARPDGSTELKTVRD